jgi:hypothetical protein
METHTAELLESEPTASEVKIAITTLKKYKTSSSDQIPGELIQAGGEILWPEIPKPINFIWNKEKLPDHRKESTILLIYKQDDKMAVVIIM